MQTVSINKSTTYPCLKVGVSNLCQPFVVLFTDSCVGTVVHDPSDRYGLGKHSTEWVEESFSLFDGKITMEN